MFASQRLYAFFPVLTFAFILAACQGNQDQQATTDYPVDSVLQDTTPPPPPEPQGPVATLPAGNDPIQILTNYEGSTLVCDSMEVGLADTIRHYADSVSALGLTYNMATNNDCSGTFIRLNEWLGGICSDYRFLSFDSVRTTRDLIKWYHDKGKLVFITDPLQSDSLIKPGAVMFYTKSGLGGNQVITAENMVSLVNHIGVIHSLETDSIDGELRITNYSLFHGRNPKRGINTTNFHKREPFGASSKPYPYGNGREQWMAVAPIVSR